MHELAGKSEVKSVLVVSICPHLGITLEIIAKNLIWGEKKRKKRKRREKRGEGRKEGSKEGEEEGR